jgi:hypothetical protein
MEKSLININPPNKSFQATPTARFAVGGRA